MGGQWWPDEWGRPSSSGGQNDAAYAYFPATRRLAIKRGTEITLYDTGDHAISGVHQQQGSRGSLEFTSQFGTFTVDSLPPVIGSTGGHQSAASPPAMARTHSQSQFQSSAVDPPIAATGPPAAAPERVSVRMPAHPHPHPPPHRPRRCPGRLNGRPPARRRRPGRSARPSRLWSGFGTRFPDGRRIHREEDRVAGSAIGSESRRRLLHGFTPPRRPHPVRSMPRFRPAYNTGQARSERLGCFTERLIDVQRQWLVPAGAVRVLPVLRLVHVPVLDLRRHLPQ